MGSDRANCRVASEGVGESQSLCGRLFICGLYDTILVQGPEDDLVAGKDPFRPSCEFCCDGIRELRAVWKLDAAQDEVDDAIAQINLGRVGHVLDRSRPVESSYLNGCPVEGKPDGPLQGVGAGDLVVPAMGNAAAPRAARREALREFPGSGRRRRSRRRCRARRPLRCRRLPQDSPQCGPCPSIR